jgi:dTDP-4-amino-4,6-dideoxygalactose transaminase
MASRPTPAPAPPAKSALRSEPFAPWPHFTPDEIDAVTRVLQSGRVNYWTGEEGRNFEQEFAAFTGCKHGVALANGTVALELALHVLGIRSGDEVVVPSRTFIASASCAVMRGAIPVCADVDRESQVLTAETIRAVLTPRTRAVIAVHLAGWPCDMDPILTLARERGLKVIEDCAQAHGASYEGRPVGGLGDVAAFSFCQDKIMTTGGEGGMLTTSDPELWERAWSFKDHGKNARADYGAGNGAGSRWVHDSFGTNWRMTEMQSALGRVLLRKLPRMVLRRQHLAAILTESFANIPALRVTRPPAEIGHSYYKYYVFVRPECLRDGWTRDRILEAIKAEGIPCNAGGNGEIYRENAFAPALRPAKRHPIAHELSETSLMFLVHPTLSEHDMHDIAKAVDKVFARAVL